MDACTTLHGHQDGICLNSAAHTASSKTRSLPRHATASDLQASLQSAMRPSGMACNLAALRLVVLRSLEGGSTSH